MLGIKNSGKTQFVESLCGQSNEEMMLYRSLTTGCADKYYSRFLIKDLSGHECCRECRTQNYPSADGIIFLISLDDFPDRVDEVRQALIEASTSTGNKPFSIVLNKRHSSNYDVVARENEVHSFVCNWLNAITQLIDLDDSRYRVSSCDVKVEAYVKGCFDEIAWSI